MFFLHKISDAMWHQPRQQVFKLLQLEDTPHSIALGGALGLFVAITPTFGAQILTMVLISIICRPLFRFNLIASFLAVYVTNPITAPLIYWGCYKVGLLFVGGKIRYDELTHLLMSGRTAGEILENLLELFSRIGYPLTIGCLIVGSIAALVTYPVVYRIVTSAQLAANRLRELKARQEKRAAASALENLNTLQTSSASVVSSAMDRPATEGRASL